MTMMDMIFTLIVAIIITAVFFWEVFHDQNPVWILILGSIAVWDWYTLINQIMNGGT